MIFEIIDNDQSVTCRLCGEKCKRIYGKHLKFKHGNITTKEYNNMFPDAPIMAISDLKTTSKNSGKHMKNEVYKKMFSEMFFGENNPNHKSKTTEEERKSRSPFSKNFIKWESEEERNNFISNINKYKPNNTQLEYWIDKGFSEEESKQKRKERQSTFNLDKCIKKYGETEGVRRFTERQNKWQESLLKNGNLKLGFSKASQILFDEISIVTNRKYKYATNGGEFKISKVNGGIWIFDFTDEENKKIIEFNGDEYHANPIKFKENDYPHPFRKTKTSKEIWNKDAEKIKAAEDNGFKVLVVWDSEFKKNKKETIEKCLNFLNQ
jgi:very-short-patch-repair endonuclease